MKIAIFSAVVGGYDNVQQPEVIRHDIDYFLYSNDIPTEKLGIWQIRRIDYYNKDKTRIARYVKTHPHIFLKGYDYCIWMDSNMLIKTNFFYEYLLGIINTGAIVAANIHPKINCAYDECIWIKFSLKDSFSNMLPLLKHIKAEGYPRNNGLCETGILIRNLHNDKVKTMCEDWWFLIDKYSKRDQLSFNYVLWKNKIDVIPIFYKDETRNNPNYTLISHKQRRSMLFIFWRFYILPLFYKPIFCLWHFYIKYLL